MSFLYSDLAKLASERPDLRKHLVPLLRQAGSTWAGIETTSWRERVAPLQAKFKDDTAAATAKWWDDLKKIIDLWFSANRQTHRQGRNQLKITVHNWGRGNRDLLIEVRGTPKKFKVHVGGQAREFGPDADLQTDVAYWLGAATGPKGAWT